MEGCPFRWDVMDWGVAYFRCAGAEGGGDFDRVFNSVSGKGKAKAGFVWPEQVAPFTGVIIVSDPRDGAKLKAAQEVWEGVVTSARRGDRSVRSVLASLVGRTGEGGGWEREEASELVIDDRASTLGSKLADSDLTGYAYRIIVGKHFSGEGKVELQYVGERGWESLLLPVEAFTCST